MLPFFMGFVYLYYNLSGIPGYEIVESRSWQLLEVSFLEADHLMFGIHHCHPILPPFCTASTKSVSGSDHGSFQANRGEPPDPVESLIGWLLHYPSF